MAPDVTSSAHWTIALAQDRLVPQRISIFSFDNAPVQHRSQSDYEALSSSPLRSAYAEAIGEPLVPDVTHLGWTGMQSSLRQWINESVPGRWRPGVVEVPPDTALFTGLRADLAGARS